MKEFLAKCARKFIVRRVVEIVMLQVARLHDQRERDALVREIIDEITKQHAAASAVKPPTRHVENEAET